jgi:hypothetical protein
MDFSVGVKPESSFGDVLEGDVFSVTAVVLFETIISVNQGAGSPSQFSQSA